jgi:hypothetical protein
VKRGLEEYWARKKATPELVLDIKKQLVVFGIDGELRTPLIKKPGEIDREREARCHHGRPRNTLGYVWFDVEFDSDVEDDSSLAARSPVC